MVQRPSQEKAKSAVFQAVLWSIAAHASILGIPWTPAGASSLARLPASLLEVELPDQAVSPQAFEPMSRTQVRPQGRRVRAAAAIAVHDHRVEPGVLKPAPWVMVAPPEYVGADTLDQRPLPLTTLSFPYPQVAGDRAQGTIELTVYIGLSGVVDHVRIDFSSVDQQIVDLAIESLLATRFSPGERDGRAVAARLRLAVDYAMALP